MALYTYPSNKLEYLVEVLSKLLDVEQKDIFKPTQLIVGSRGMQHWLSMQLAESRSIAMNLKYDMVNSYILDICYEITAKQEYKKAYTRDTLTWRIFKILSNSDLENSKLKEYYIDSDIKKYQLSAKIAEVFSKYISYRSDWLEIWESGEYINIKAEEDEDWQRYIWQKLVLEIPYTPHSIQKQAITKFSIQTLQKINVPSNIYLFGINTVSPRNLNFLFELAKYIDLNILYINPCSEYWGDLKNKNISAWLGNDDYEAQPLLANLGQQGKEFINTLIDTPAKQEFEVFENAKKLENIKQSQLVSLQRNLLELDCYNHSKQKDNTISINSCHSPLREVQILHDKLLDIIKIDESIKARDILVMCPNIEDYSPYIDSVFSRYSNDKKLACSIADRTLLDSEPLAASFMDLLQLPESNFEVNKILDYLTVPAIQQKFNISNNQLETIHYWLKQTCIHHSNDGGVFSWAWGLRRLILGFSYSDSEYIVNNSLLTVPIIEGSEIIELGGLYELLERLAEYSNQLLETRSFAKWQDYLLKMFDDVFNVAKDDEYIAKKIKDIIVTTTNQAKGIIGDEKVDLYTIRYCLNLQLSEPIINNHFLNGKVTFCSMTPMRNIPFKVVAMLGLNNGKFPRQETAISFDLIARLGRRSGDRTKRNDDRYLFLETILSARSNSYFSYIGKSVKTNSEQQSSLVLKEFINYLQKNYAWNDSDIKEFPLHAFSPKCYSDKYRSYDHAWLKLLKADIQDFYNIKASNDNKSKLLESLTVPKFVNIFDNPLKAYANYSLDLYLGDNFEELEDSEPFDIKPLDRYQLKQNLFSDFSNNINIEQTLKKNKLSGRFPDSVLTDDELNLEVMSIGKLVTESKISEFKYEYLVIGVLGYELSTSCYIKNDQLMLCNPSKLRIKHKFELYLTALIVAYKEQKNISAIYYYLEKNEVKEFVIRNISYMMAISILESYIREAQCLIKKPKLAHLALAEALFTSEHNTDKKQQEVWNRVISDENNYKALDKDEYFRIFYSENPSINDFEGTGIFQDFFEVINED